MTDRQDVSTRDAIASKNHPLMFGKPGPTLRSRQVTASAGDRRIIGRRVNRGETTVPPYIYTWPDPL